MTLGRFSAMRWVGAAALAAVGVAVWAFYDAPAAEAGNIHVAITLAFLGAILAAPLEQWAVLWPGEHRSG